jgi:hypothetical protein
LDEAKGDTKRHRTITTQAEPNDVKASKLWGVAVGNALVLSVVSNSLGLESSCLKLQSMHLQDNWSEGSEKFETLTE